MTPTVEVAWGRLGAVLSRRGARTALRHAGARTAGARVLGRVGAGA